MALARPPAVIIEGTRFAGTWTLDLNEQPLNGWDLRIIKQISEVDGTDLRQAFAQPTYDFVMALAVVALRRAGQITKSQIRDAEDELLEAEIGKVTLDRGERAEGDAIPPESEPVERNEKTEANGTSGSSSSGPSDGQAAPILTPTGHPS